MFEVWTTLAVVIKTGHFPHNCVGCLINQAFDITFASFAKAEARKP